MAKRTPVHEIRTRISGSYVPGRYRNLYTEMLLAFGVDPNRTEEAMSGISHDDYGDGILRYEDVRSNLIEHGKVDVIRASAMIAMARLFSRDPSPEYVGIDGFRAEIRKQLFNDSYRSDADEQAGFVSEAQFGYLDYDSLGVGALKSGLVTDRYSNEPRVHLQHCPVTQFLYDRFCRHPSKSRFVATWDYVEPDELLRIGFSKKDIDNARMPYNKDGEARPRQLEFVRLLEYYDVGFGTGRPTYAAWLGSIENPPVVVEDNPDSLGHLPMAWGVGFIAPGMRYPIGRIKAQLAVQEAMRDVRDAMHDIMDMQAVDFINVDALQDPDESWDDLNDGARRIRIRGMDKNQMIALRLQSQQMSTAMTEYWGQLNNELNIQSNMSELDRGNMLGPSRSATELSILDSRLKMNQALAVNQTQSYIRRIVTKFEQAVNLGDYHPRTLNIKSRQMRVNMPGVPESWVGNWTNERATILIGLDSITADEDAVKRMARRENLMILAQLLQGRYNQSWFQNELVKSMGFDPQEALDMSTEALDMAASGSPQSPLAPMGGAQAGHSNTAMGVTALGA